VKRSIKKSGGTREPNRVPLVLHHILKNETKPEKRMRHKFILATLAIISAASLAACANTVHGAGKDIENAGESVQEAVPSQ